MAHRSRAGAVAAFIVALACPAAAHAQAAAPSACQDFYTSVNASWLRRASAEVRTILATSRRLPEGSRDTVRADTIRIDAFTAIGAEVQRTLRRILDRARVAAATSGDSLVKVVGTYYASCLAAAPADSAEAAATDGGVRRCIEATDRDLGIALGWLYVKEILSPTAQRRVIALTEQLRAAMDARLRANPWMTAETKAAARAKLAAMVFRVANPDSAKDYGRLVLSPTDFAANRRAVKYVTYQRSLHDMAGMGDKQQWLFRQYFVNAAYFPQKNTLEVPAVMLQPPYFDSSDDVAENYAGIGYVIGHEITHAFDPQGALYDATGAMRNWWVSSDRAAFAARSELLVAQYDRYRVRDSVGVNGPLTLNENVADLGGLNIALDAYRAGRPPGAARDQRFFRAYAAIWRSAGSPERDIRLAREDVHAPDQWRVNGVLANMPAFARAFGCRAGDAMVRAPKDLVDIW